MCGKPLTMLSVLAIALAGTAVRAEPPSDPKGRYTMTPVDGGFMRLDTETGAVALCVKKDSAWACEPVKDGTVAPGRTSELEAENKALKDRVKALEESKGATARAPDNSYPTEPPGGSVSQLPTEEEVDKAFDYIEGMYKKLRERIKKFETEPGTKPDVKPNADSGPGAL